MTANVPRAATHLNVQRGGLQESMKKSDELRSRCNSVVNKAEIERRPDHNDDEQDGQKSTVN
jgi:hypothetical protein